MTATNSIYDCNDSIYGCICLCVLRQLRKLHRIAQKVAGNRSKSCRELLRKLQGTAQKAARNHRPSTASCTWLHMTLYMTATKSIYDCNDSIYGCVYLCVLRQLRKVQGTTQKTARNRSESCREPLRKLHVITDLLVRAALGCI